METNDRLVWISTKNGQYIVLSGCTVEQTRREQARVDEGPSNKVWRRKARCGRRSGI